MAVAIALTFGARGLRSETAVSPYDMPRYLMNGVFLLDLISSGVPTSQEALMGFAAEYYARYPALSIGHHPPLLPAMLVPAYALFGVSVVSARLVVFVSFVVGVLAIYAMGRRLYGATVGAWAAAFFACHPMILRYEQLVLSEGPMLTLILLAGWQLATFAHTGKARHYAGFAAAAALSLYARQLAVFALPAYALIVLVHGDWRRLLARDTLTITAITLLIIAPIVPMTSAMAPFNLEVVASDVGKRRLLEALRRAAEAGLRPVVWVVALLAVGHGLLRRRALLYVPVGWVAGVVVPVALLTGTIEPERYAIGAVPGVCLLAATLAADLGTRSSGVVRTVVLAAALAIQAAFAAPIHPPELSGYEPAARWVLEHTRAPTVLFNGPIDTGYFSFFLRKHDADRRLVMLRGDKLFATSFMAWHGVTERIDRPEAIYPILQRYGTQYIVLEDVESVSRPLNWLRDELKTPRFAERARFSLGSSDEDIRDVSLVIYEYLAATPADPNATLDLDLPLVGRRIVVRLKDLTDGVRSRGRIVPLENR